MNKILIAFLIAGVFVAGFFISKTLYKPKDNSSEQAVILIEQIKAVSKLISVEANMSELYTYKDYWKFNWFPFQKKAIIRIRAKVSAGYDLGKIRWEVDATKRTIFMHDMPKPEILSIEHDLDYYDMTEGTFNHFRTEDLNKMNKTAKDLIYQKAMDSYILVEAAKKGLDLIKVMQTNAGGAGWKIEIAQ